MAYYVQGVVMRERGPVFVATFNPLCVVITAALGVVVLSESIHLGRYFFTFYFFLKLIIFIIKLFSYNIFLQCDWNDIYNCGPIHCCMG